jgi:hypothetical protein
MDVIDPVTGDPIQGAVYALDHFTRRIPIKISFPDGRRISVDAGNVVFEGVKIVRYDDANGDLHVEDLQVPVITVHGPHPLFMSNRFCEVVRQCLG